MRENRIYARRRLAQKALVLAAVSAMGLIGGSRVSAGAVPVFGSGEAGTFNEQSGTPKSYDSPYFVALPISSTPPTLLQNSIYFNDEDGSCTAAAGLQNSQSSTSTKIIISPGTGISQNNPDGDESASSLEIYFEAEWSIPAGGFGPPLAGNFSLPIGAKVGVNGTASVTCTIDWDYLAGTTEIGLKSYRDSKSFSNFGGESTIEELTSLTAPTTLFSPSTLPAGDDLIMTGDITFTALGDDPTLIEIPTADDFSDVGVTTDEVGSFSSDAVPEPSSALLLGVASCGLLLRRKRIVTARIPSS